MNKSERQKYSWIPSQFHEFQSKETHILHEFEHLATNWFNFLSRTEKNKRIFF